MASKIPETGNKNKASSKSETKKDSSEGICWFICHSITLKQTNKNPKQNSHTNLVPCTFKQQNTLSEQHLFHCITSEMSEGKEC